MQYMMRFSYIIILFVILLQSIQASLPPYRLLIHLVDALDEAVHVVGMLPVQRMDDALLVDELVGRIAVDTDITFDGALLVFGQVVVDAVRSRQVVLANDALPRLVAAVVGQEEIDDVVVFQGFPHPPRVLQVLSARSAPRSPNIEIDNLALIGFDEFAEYLLAIAHALHISRWTDAVGIDKLLFRLFHLHELAVLQMCWPPPRQQNHSRYPIPICRTDHEPYKPERRSSWG